MLTMSLDYKNLSEVTVTNQEEMDAIPDDFKGRIYIESNFRISIGKRYYWRVVARENSSVVAWGNSSVVARGNSSVVAWGNSSVVARENSSVVARGNSSVEAWGNSSVVAWGNSQIVDRLLTGKIQVSGNARIVYMPKNIHEFMDFYGIKHTKTKAIFYKAVRKSEDGKLISDYDENFEYIVGKTKKEICDTNPDYECSFGIHISHLDWALSFGRDWNNLAIIECEVKIADIVVPKNTDGKVRTSKVKVIREVPLEECGVFGKILAKGRR